MHRRPAAWLFLSALVGSLMGAHYNLGHWPWMMIILLLIFFKAIQHDLFRIFSLLLFIFLVSAFHADIKRDRYLKNIAAIPEREKIYSGIVYRVDKQEDGSLRAIVKIDAESHSYKIKLILRDALSLAPINVGHMIRFQGKIEAFSHPLSPVVFNAIRFGMANDLHGSLTLQHKNQLWIGSQVFSSYFSDLRTTLSQRILNAVSPREASILTALMIGDTRLFAEDQIEIFRSLGVLHLLAVSGLQVTIFFSMCFAILSILFSMLLPIIKNHHAKSYAAIISIILGFWFIGLAGFQSSAVRAFLMATILLFRVFLFRKIDIYDSFFVAGLVTILYDPIHVFDLGYLLSYAAVFGLMVAHTHSQQLTAKIKSFVLSSMASILINSWAAFLFTLPIIALFGNVVAPFAIVANLFLVPIAFIFQVPAIIFGLLGSLTDWPSLISLASYFANVIELAALGIDNIFSPRLYLFSWPTISLIIMTISIILLFLYLLKYHRALLFISLISALFACIPFFIAKDHLEITIIPVGQGDSTLFALPSGQTILVDTGGVPFSDFDVGERIILPTLKRKGINQIDVLVITHPDPDHILGAFSLINAIAIKEIWHSGYNNDHPLTKQLSAMAQEKNIVVKTTADLLGHHRYGNTEVQVLAPDTTAFDNYFPELGANDNSVVLRIIHGGQTLLWPGDIEQFGEHLLLSSNKNIQATILKAPHHGSRTSSSADLITAVNPAHVIYSTGHRNRFSFPHDEVVNRFREHGAQEWNTADDGEITIKISEHDMRICAYKNRICQKA